LDVLLLIIQIRTAQTWNPRFTFRFISSILVLSTLFNVILSHFGETILFTIPKQTPLINGVITAEAALYGFTNGLVLIGMFSIFTILNQVLPVRALVGLIPQAYQPIAVVTTIAITFIPSTQRQFQAIKEAQAIRGQQLKGIRDWLPLFIPLLIGGLERAMQIAEAMTARGFIAQTKKADPKRRLFLILSLSLIVLGWLIQLNQPDRRLGWAFLSSGVLIFLFLIVFTGVKNKRTRYTQEKWHWPSSLVTMGGFVSVFLFLTPYPGQGSLLYSPYPQLTFPELALTQLIALFLILTPILFPTTGQYAEN
jgi:energy-coupling factor transport system permease protein